MRALSKASNADRRTTVFAAIAAIAAATFLGAFAGQVGPIAFAAGVGLIAFLPVFSHVRWVGWKRAITEPTPATVILLFYVATFPQRALVITLDEHQYVQFVPGPVDAGQLVDVLVLGAVLTAVIVEAFHFASRGSRPPRASETSPPGNPRNLIMFAVGIQVVALVSLLGIVRDNGGISGTIATFGSHDKELFAGAASLWLSLWSTFGIPSIWAAAAIVSRRDVVHSTKVVTLALTLGIVVGYLYLFGNRLHVILGLVGAWAIWYFAGRRVPVSLVVAAVAAMVLVSIPILHARSGSDTRVPEHSRLSTLVGYSIMDISLAIHQRPERIREQMRDPDRWVELPGFLIPLWPSTADFNSLRSDAMTAREFGAPNQQTTGFPPTFITEGWLLFGLLGAALWAALFGAVTGLLHKHLVGRQRPSSAQLLWYALVVSMAFTYYKDGDTFGATVSIWRTVMYVGIAMLITGVWAPRSLLGRRPASGTA